MTAPTEAVNRLLGHLSECGFTPTAPGQFALEAGAVRWRVVIETTRLVRHKIVVYVGSSEVGDFVRRALERAVNPKGRLSWFPGGSFFLGQYEQRAEAMPLVDQAAIEMHYSEDDKRQVQYQTDVFLARMAPLTKAVRSLYDYGAILAADDDPFPWGTDHAVMRVAAIRYLARRLDSAMPRLPEFVERQFMANAADSLAVASMQEYLELVSQLPLEQ